MQIEAQQMPEDAPNNIIFRIDQNSFKQIYLLYWEKVFSICYHHIGETEPAKGMVQDIFKSLWERKDELEIRVSIEHYLVRSAKFKVFEYIRNTRSREKHCEIMSAGYCSSENCTENEIMFNSLKDQVELLVDTLPCQCKRVFKMSREQGLSNKEIASSLLISERAVEYHITRALSTLRTSLAAYIS